MNLRRTNAGGGSTGARGCGGADGGCGGASSAGSGPRQTLRIPVIAVLARPTRRARRIAGPIDTAALSIKKG